MQRANDLSPTQEKIVSHLAPLSRLAGSYLQPRLVTQDGVAQSVGIARNHVPRAVIDLMRRGYVFARKARVDGCSRKRTCYFLTDEGRVVANGLGKRALAPKTLSVAPPADFVGRSRELRELAAFARDGPATLILYGERGMGKTSLLRRFMAGLGTERTAFYWSLKRDGTLREGLESLAATLPEGAGGLLGYIMRSEREIPYARVASILGEVRPPMLIALDDTGHAQSQAEVESLARAMADGRAAKLVLSTDGPCPTLAEGTWGRLDMGPLSEEETLALARRQGYPIPSEAFAQTGGRPLLLSPRRGGDAPLTDDAALSRGERRLLGLLAAFGRPVHVGEIAQLGIDYQVVSWLTEKGALMSAGGHVHLAPQFVLPESGSPEERRRAHLRIARALVATWDDAGHAAEACSHLVKAGALRECGKALRDAGEPMLKAGLGDKLEAIIGQLDLGHLDKGDRANALILKGNLRKMKGKWGEAIACFEEAMALLGRDRAPRAETMARIASVHLAKRDLDAALRAYGESMDALPRGNPHIEARICDELATLHLRKGEIEKAEEHSERAVALARRSRRDDLIGLCEATRGNVCMLRGRLDEAAEHYKAALDRIRAAKNVRMEGTILNNIAAIRYKGNRLAEAVALWRESAALFERHGDPRYGMSLVNLAMALWETGAWEESGKHRKRALAVARMSGDKNVEAEALAIEGHEAMAAGKAEEAVGRYARSCEARVGAQDRGSLAGARVDISRAHLALGKIEDASATAREFVEWAALAPRSEGRAAALHAWGLIQLAARNVAGAESTLRDAMAATDQSNLRGRARLCRTLGALSGLKGEWYISMRYLEDSVALFERLGDKYERAVSNHDLALALARFSLPNGDETMEEARRDIEALGAKFPPSLSDWRLANPG
ncbi:MAG: hypothetical protein HZB92_00865 [Euryarchaeota archaeon]|nr:hypothetical protein [Euryarchaeota archaeon]